MMLDFLADSEIQRTFLDGLLVTLRISAIAAVLAFGIATLMAFARVSDRRWARWMAAIYVESFRNTPLLIQLYLYYRGLQSIGVILSPELCGILALACYTGAYLTEVFRSGLLAIPAEQREAGMSLGLSHFGVYRLILAPQAFRLVLPAIGNQLISLVKNSSLVAFITVSDLFLVIYKGAVDHFQPIEYFTVGAVIYLSVSLGISALTRCVEVWLSPLNKVGNSSPPTGKPPVSGMRPPGSQEIPHYG